MVYDHVDYEEVDASIDPKTALDAVDRLLRKQGQKLVYVPTGGSWYRFFITDADKEYVITKL